MPSGDPRFPEKPQGLGGDKSEEVGLLAVTGGRPPVQLPGVQPLKRCPGAKPRRTKIPVTGRPTTAGDGHWGRRDGSEAIGKSAGTSSGAQEDSGRLFGLPRRKTLEGRWFFIASVLSPSAY